MGRTYIMVTKKIKCKTVLCGKDGFAFVDGERYFKT